MVISKSIRVWKRQATSTRNCFDNSSSSRGTNTQQQPAHLTRPEAAQPHYQLTFLSNLSNLSFDKSPDYHTSHPIISHASPIIPPPPVTCTEDPVFPSPDSGKPKPHWGKLLKVSRHFLISAFSCSSHSLFFSRARPSPQLRRPSNTHLPPIPSKKELEKMSYASTARPVLAHYCKVSSLGGCGRSLSRACLVCFLKQAPFETSDRSLFFFFLIPSTSCRGGGCCRF